MSYKEVKEREDGTKIYFNDFTINRVEIKEDDGSVTCYDSKDGIYSKRKDGSEIHYSVKRNYAFIPPEIENSWLESTIKALKTKEPFVCSWVKDKKGNETHYNGDGTVSDFYDKEKNVKKYYRADGTLLQEDNYNTDAVTYYENDGKTVSNIVKGGAEWNTHDMAFDKGKLKHIYEIKDHYQNGDGRGDVKLSEKDIAYHYEADGETLDHWTVKKEDSWLTADEQGYFVTAKKEKSTKTYKKDDIKAITSGDVPGYAFIDAHLQLSDSKGEPVWVKQAKEKTNKKITARKNEKKKQTATALKVQKEGQYVTASKQSAALTAPWAKDSQKKVEAKTAQKAQAKVKARKTTAQKKNTPSKERA